jgi:UDP-N-acetylglucosamine 3-dehydrogenase
MLKVGVIGIGAMGKNHARVYSELDGIQFVGVSDLNEEVGTALARKFNCGYYKDYRELLKEVDAVTVAVPTSFHHKVGMDAVETGVHILMEKPLAHTIEEGKELVRAAREKGLTFAVGHIERHNPVVGQTKKLLTEGRFGSIITMASRRVSNFPARIRDVGVIMDLAVHDIDIARYLAGSEVSELYAAGGKSGACEFEDHATIVLKFMNGTVGIVDTNWLTPMRVREMTLTCEKNLIKIDYMAQSIDISSSKLGELDDMNLYKLPMEMETVSVGLRKEEPLKLQLKDFISAIETGSDPLVTGDDGIMAITLAQAALESMCTNSTISFR